MTKKRMQVRLIRALYLAFLTVFSFEVWADSAPQEENSVVQENNYQAALAYFQGLAEKGDPVGHYYLAAMYAEGKGVVHYPKKAAHHYELAANKGYMPAQYALGEAYASGKGGTPKDYAMAAKWWERAAKQGHVEAQYELGQLFYEGLGVRKNQREAIKWYRKASQQRHPEALKIIAMLDARDEQVAASPASVPELEHSAVDNETTISDGESSALIETQESMALAEAETESKPEMADQGTDYEETIALIDQELLDTPNTALGINKEAWIMSQPSDNYTIQIFFERSEDKVLEFMSQLGSAENSAYFLTRYKGKEYIAVIYGSYPTYTQARGVLDDLPESAKKNLPWIREYNHIQNSLASAGFSQQVAEGELAVAP